MSNVPAKLWDRPRIADEDRRNELKKEIFKAQNYINLIKGLLQNKRNIK